MCQSDSGWGAYREPRDERNDRVGLFSECLSTAVWVPPLHTTGLMTKGERRNESCNWLFDNGFFSWLSTCWMWKNYRKNNQKNLAICNFFKKWWGHVPRVPCVNDTEAGNQNWDKMRWNKVIKYVCNIIFGQKDVRNTICSVNLAALLFRIYEHIKWMTAWHDHLHQKLISSFHQILLNSVMQV